jgi:hypothetical protein
MPILLYIACVGAVAGVLTAAPAIAAESLNSVATDGLATLTMCRSYLFYSDCKSYNRVAVPVRIALGDTIDLDFGSNPKRYEFRVMRILSEAGRCAIYDAATGDPEKLDRIVVEPCPAVP